MSDAHPDDGDVRLEVVAEPVESELGPELRAALVAHPVVRRRFPNADFWVVGVDRLGKGGGEEEPWFGAVLLDIAGSDVADAEGSLWDLDSLGVAPTGRTRLPHDDEHAWALDVLRADPDLGPKIEAGQLEPYRPMPPLESIVDADGAVLRAVAVGLREPHDDGSVHHWRVAVASADGEIRTTAEPAPGEGGVPDGVACGAPEAESQARVRTWRGDVPLWDLVVVRPSASSGVNGSGVELRVVDYQGVRVLHRAHVPIATVGYADGAGTRTWLSHESCFDAEGDEPVAGFRVCSGAPATVVQQGAAGGGFRGVGLWLDGEDLHIVSQLEAGWYRYVCEWILRADGTIQPRLSFGAVHNPRTVDAHTHHAYWRLDFDVVAEEPNQVQEHNEPTLPGQLARWHTIRYEVRRARDPGRGRQWRVRNVRTPHGYAVVPGPGDGTADRFGAGDVWVLAYRMGELDDGEGFTDEADRARPHLDRLVRRELVERADVVLWYGIHVDGGDGHPTAPAGPDLVPFNWKPVAKREAYGPLVPPVLAGPDDEDDDEDEDEEEDAAEAGGAA